MKSKASKTAIGLFLSLLMLLACTGNALALNPSDVPPAPIVYEDVLGTQTESQQSPANAAYAVLMNNMDERLSQYYGGSYIGDDGKLHVITANNSITSKTTIGSVFQANSAFVKIQDNIVYEEGLYSYQFLYTQYKAIEELMFAGDLLDVHAVYIDEIKNCVVISVMNPTEEKIEIIKNALTNSDAIVFEEFGGFEFDSSPGASLKFYLNSSNPTYGGSFGFWVKKGSEVGFVSAAHNYNGILSKVYTSTDTLIGNVAGTGMNTYDVCYVKSNGVASPSREAPIIGKTIAGYTNTFTTGMAINKAGSGSTSSGTLVSGTYSLSISYNGSTYNISGLSGASYSATGGDSGGLVYVVDSSDRVFIAGIHNGRMISGSNTIALFTTYSNVCTAVGVAMW